MLKVLVIIPFTQYSGKFPSQSQDYLCSYYWFFRDGNLSPEQQNHRLHYWRKAPWREYIKTQLQDQFIPFHAEGHPGPNITYFLSKSYCMLIPQINCKYNLPFSSKSFQNIIQIMEYLEWLEKLILLFYWLKRQMAISAYYSLFFLSYRVKP